MVGRRLWPPCSYLSNRLPHCVYKKQPHTGWCGAVRSIDILYGVDGAVTPLSLAALDSSPQGEPWNGALNVPLTLPGCQVTMTDDPVRRGIPHLAGRLFCLLFCRNRKVRERGTEQKRKSSAGK